MSISSHRAVEYAMGKGGFQTVTGTSVNDGPFCALQTITGCVIASMTGEGITWAAGTSVPAGINIVGTINSFQLTSGTVIAYNGKIT